MAAATVVETAMVAEVGEGMVMAIDDSGPESHPVTDRRIEIKLDLIAFTDLNGEREGNHRLRASADGLPSFHSGGFEIRGD